MTRKRERHTHSQVSQRQYIAWYVLQHNCGASRVAECFLETRSLFLPLSLSDPAHSLASPPQLSTRFFFFRMDGSWEGGLLKVKHFLNVCIQTCRHTCAKHWNYTHTLVHTDGKSSWLDQAESSPEVCPISPAVLSTSTTSANGPALIDELTNFEIVSLCILTRLKPNYTVIYSLLISHEKVWRTALITVCELCVSTHTATHKHKHDFYISALIYRTFACFEWQEGFICFHQV